MSVQHFDIVVIGGGINGVGVALDTVGRGLSVCLCEKGDLASATSSSSSKLIHGGLRYLEQYEFRLVREALSEREVLLEKAPHIMWPLRFRLPHQKHLRPAWMIRTGLFLYDHLAKRVSLPSSKKIKNPTSSALSQKIKTCFEYSDGWVDDARLVVLNAMAAKDKGADIRPRTECISATKQDDHWLVELRDIHGVTTTISCSTIVNATGPWAVSFIDRLDDTANPNAMRMVKGSHMIVPRIYDSEEAYILQNEDNRIVFIIPYEDEFTLVGTTDEDYQGDPDKAAISNAETDYLIDIFNDYFKATITRKDVIHSYSGVRPLLEEANASAQELTRDYKVEVDGEMGKPSLVNIFGGKITTYRKLAEHATNKLLPLFNSNAKPWTKEARLPGGDFSTKADLINALQTSYPWLTSKMTTRFVRQYGTLCHRFLSSCNSLNDLGEHFGHGLYQAEVDYLINDEWALTSEDVLWRRTKMGLLLDKQQVSKLDRYLATHNQTQNTIKEVSWG